MPQPPPYQHAREPQESRPWLKVAARLPDDPKVHHLARLLALDPLCALGIPVALWAWAFKRGLEGDQRARKGDLSAFTPQQIADALRWTGDAERLVDALVECRAGGQAGFLERTRSRVGTRLQIHDWHELSGSFFAGVDREEEYRARKSSLFSGVHGARIRAAVKERDGDACQACGRSVDWLDRRTAGGGTYVTLEPARLKVETTAVACRGCASTVDVRQKISRSLLVHRQAPATATVELRQKYGSSTAEQSASPGGKYGKNSTVHYRSSTVVLPHKESESLAAPSPRAHTRTREAVETPSLTPDERQAVGQIVAALEQVIGPASTPAAERRRLDHARGIWRAGGTPQEVCRRALNYPLHFPSRQLTDYRLEADWDTCGSRPPEAGTTAATATGGGRNGRAGPAAGARASTTETAINYVQRFRALVQANAEELGLTAGAAPHAPHPADTTRGATPHDHPPTPPADALAPVDPLRPDDGYRVAAPRVVTLSSVTGITG